jgi:hypothetical protein
MGFGSSGLSREQAGEFGDGLVKWREVTELKFGGSARGPAVTVYHEA